MKTTPYFLLGALIAYCSLCLGGCFESREPIQQAAAAVPIAQSAADAAKDRVAALQVELASAKADAEAKTKEATQAKQDAEHAPLIAILHIAEALSMLAVLLGVVELVITRIWALGAGPKLGEGMILCGVALLIVCGLLQTALQHAQLILATSCIPIAVVGYVWLKRMGMLSTLATDATQTAHAATTALSNLGHAAAAEAIVVEHKAVAAEHGVVAWVEQEWAKLRGESMTTVVLSPAAPAAPTAAPKV